MPFVFGSAALVAIMLFRIAQAHMIMYTPTPFGKATNTKPTKDPLQSTGADFPCKFDGAYVRDATPPTVMPIGVNQTLSWEDGDTAVHGGGSCQISLTRDANPTKNSTWMVIHSVVGGCPANVPANLQPSEHLNAFQYSIPEGIVPGDYVLAWTWFNRVGQREMYMNCAPITVTGGSKRKRYEIPRTSKSLAERAIFPNMFVAEIPCDNPCQLPENFDVNFPSPGDSVVFAGESANKKDAPANCSSGSGGYPKVPSHPSTCSNGLNGGSSPAPGSSAPNPAANVGSPASSPPPPGSSPCSTPGAEVCSADGTMIGTCDITNAVIMGPVAAGTKCVNGAIVATNIQRNVSLKNRGGKDSSRSRSSFSGKAVAGGKQALGKVDRRLTANTIGLPPREIAAMAGDDNRENEALGNWPTMSKRGSGARDRLPALY